MRKTIFRDFSCRIAWEISEYKAFLMLFLAEGGVDFDTEADEEGGGAGDHDKPEEIDVALRTVGAENVDICKDIMQPAGKHSGNHHSQSHEGSAEGIMRCLALSTAEID